MRRGLLVRIYGTHLEDYDDQGGIHRLRGIETLLQNIEDSSSTLEPMLIVGDLNQQRERDYAKDEWAAICQNKKKRKAPTDDGVASKLEEAGFVCNLDFIRRHSNGTYNKTSFINWKSTDPPPATHWSGTIVDYSYGRGKGLAVSSLYVSPCGLSDHRLVVTDWDWPAAPPRTPASCN
jgi:endonuclease/exonuclease/phosphatase family metal-dependent hydrolase